MSKVTAEMVKTLRERTGVGMSKCKQALDEANGDMEKAIENLRKAGMATAVKKEGREANEGLIGYAETDDTIALLELNAETDFVVQNEKFQNFLKNLCDDLVKTKPSNLEVLAGQAYGDKPGISVEEARAELVLSLGENIKIKRFELIAKENGHSYGVYSHMGGRILTLVEIGGDSDQQQLAKDIAMHIAADAPEFLNPDAIPADVLNREIEIAKSQIGDKPDYVLDKILDGKMNSFYEQSCLTKQKFVKDPSMTIEKLVEEVGKKTSQPLQIVRFLRWQIGQG
ncbi:MAG TPA: translation elongation factor Ts [Chlamydiales bacterium]|nr:elongation factor Ts [Chlamydiales bacterium]HPE84836.1 translation elongation factor Ts [Chlamydiales bacterium]